MRVIIEDLEPGHVVVVGLVEGPVEYEDDDPDPGEEAPEEEATTTTRLIAKVVNL